MAGDWIKMRTDLYRDPKVIVMANLLGQKDSHLSRHVNQFMQRDMSVTSNVTRCAVVGALVAVWGVARHQGHRDGDDLIIRGVNSILLDDLSELPGFGDVMTEVGWAVDTDAGLLFPKFFAENNVDPEDQKREQAALRKRRQREREQRDNERDVARDKSVTVTHREEKSREEYSSSYVPPESEAKSEEEEIQAKMIQVGITKPGVAALAIATAGVEATRGVLEWLESRKVLGCLPYASGVICNRLTQAGRASLPPDQGWNCEETAEYRKAVEKSKQSARKLRESVERIPILELTARHGPWADGLDLSSERVKLERENQVWRMEPDSKVRVELMRRKEMEERNAKAEAG